MLRLTRVVINGFWGNRRFDLHLDNDVNILAGINGSGKTTVLDIVASILCNDPNEPLSASLKYDNATLYFTGNYKAVCMTIGEEKKVLFYFEEREISFEIFAKECCVDTVSTFDTGAYSQEYQQKLKERYPWIDSDLDYQLADSLLDYQQYQAKVSNLVENLLGKSDVDMTLLREQYNLIERTRQVCETFFAPKLKWNRDNSEIQFLLSDSENVFINPQDLSSGEKHLLILLISTMIERENECIVFWDEPEISLHIDWQHQLIRQMRLINPNMQLIIATHSPALIYEGWEQRVLNMSKLFSNE